MNDSYRIRFPRQGKPVPLIKGKFVAAGEATAKHCPNLVGLLMLDSQVVATSHSRRGKNAHGCPCDPDDKHWLMIFDLRHAPQEVLAVLTGPKKRRFSLVIARIDGDEMHIKCWRNDVQFKDGCMHPDEIKGVPVTYPDPNTTGLCCQLTTYGAVTSTDTKLQSAILDDGANPVSASASDTEDGLWWATFNVINTTNPYTLKTTGDKGGTGGPVANLVFDRNCLGQGGATDSE